MPTEYFEQRERALLGPRYEQLYAAPQEAAERGVTVSALRAMPEQFAQTLDAAHGDGHAGPRLNGGRKRVFGLVQISASHVRLPCVSCQRRLVAEILILRLPCPQRRSDRRAQAPS